MQAAPTFAELASVCSPDHVTTTPADAAAAADVDAIIVSLKPRSRRIN